MPWVPRGLRDGIITSRYPRRPDGYGSAYRAGVSVVAPEVSTGSAPCGPRGQAEGVSHLDRGMDFSELCPTGAITVEEGDLRVDRGRCILCGRCVTEHPELFAFDPDIEVAALERESLVVPSHDPAEQDQALERSRTELARRVRVLRRSVHIRHVDAGSDGAEEWEIAALTNPVYDLGRLGVFFTASPRHADLLLVTGAGTAGMAGPLRRTWQAMPSPKVAIAAGTDAISGGMTRSSYATQGGIGGLVPVDVWVPGSPPSPFSLLNGILVAVGLLQPRKQR